MSALPSLIDVLERSAADRLVLAPGDRPHLFAGATRRDVGTSTISSAAVEAIAAQILSSDARAAVQREGAVRDHVRTLESGDVLSVRAEYRGADLHLELVRTKTQLPLTDAVAVPTAPAADPATRQHTSVAQYISSAWSHGATAVYVRPGAQPAIRITGGLRPWGDGIVDAETFDAWMHSVQRDGVHETLDTWTMAGRGGEPVRCRIVVDAQGPFAIVTTNHAESRQHVVPRGVQDICESRDGVLVVSAPTARELAVIVTGVAGFCGIRRGGYVVSMEPPEGPAVHVNGRFVSRRIVPNSELGPALTGAAAELPDVIAIVSPSGISHVDAVTTAARTCLVVIGVVAPTAVASVSMLLRNTDERSRGAVGEVLEAAINHRRIRRLGGGHVLVRDILRPDASLRGALVRADVPLLATSLATCDGNGDAELARAVVREHLSLRTAVAYASNAAHVVALVRQQRREQRRAATRPQPVDEVETPAWADLSTAL